ncbi:HET-domain-containing [Fusarium albosuccineum]|uniref:HET-domain-containing n=1 Tax=Fusarium albosuccineum TaxID=1237068 RepID=A0A8H4PCP8_9HYPO|nr:HET-domain-containing [Fusarium albosuccineum]
MNAADKVVLAVRDLPTALPPENPECEICFNLNPEILLAVQQWEIKILDNDEFLESASQKCLACRMVLEGVVRFTRSSTFFPAVNLRLNDFDEDSKVPLDERQLIANITRTRWGDWKPGEVRPLWDSDTGGSLLLEFYSLPGEPARWSVIQQCPEPALDSTSDAAAATVKKWMTTCSASHAKCRQSDSSTLPTRVLYVGDENEPPRLVRGNGRHEPYVALSWCWGKQPPLKTLKSNIQDHEKGVFSTLPTLFHDAAQVTRKLDIDYLWIDALCIIQDSPEDWAAESVKMTEVYDDAALTIAADMCGNAYQSLSGLDSHAKLFLPEHHVWGDGPYRGTGGGRLGGDGRLRNLFRARYPMPYRMPDGEETSVRVRTIELRNSEGYHGTSFLPASTLSGRAWCFQENILSRRILHFGPTEMSWQCLEMEACECVSQISPPGNSYGVNSGLIRMKDLIRFSDVDMLNTWLDIVEAFTFRDLTNPTDRLPAIAGIAKMMAERFEQKASLAQAKYLSGIWMAEIESQLAWFVKPPAMRFKPLARESFRQSRVPTWSWASVTGSIDFVRWARFNLLSIETVPDSFGALSTALIVKGRLWEKVEVIARPGSYTTALAWKWIDGLKFLVASPVSSPTRIVFMDPFLSDEWTFVNLEKGSTVGKEFYYALENSEGGGLALLLRKLPDNSFSTGGPALFQRIGVIFPDPLSIKLHDGYRRPNGSFYEKQGITEQVVAIV